ncbi:hypothetical protein Taro_047825 [Colocasia esculenta]|uniref:FLZ-type domain-containing protein n=1 Tax=Colocasia esculenta TaxID=4460 RepID=A0A843X702_COLES|nr:hypothetical protein [Colocasia esculenta]
MADVDTVLFPPVLRRSASYRASVGRALPSRVPHADVTFSLEPRPWEDEEEPRHPRDACCLCRRPLRADAEVYMYRGDTPFCSEECRQEQMALDEAREWETRFQRRRRQHHRSAAPAENLRVRDSGAIVAS